MICISFDTDHMDDARMATFLEAVEIPGTATFFCTARFADLEGTGHELAPHPTLPEGAEWQSELQRMRELFPDAQGWRSHSCVFSHVVAAWLSDNGYRYASTNDQFGQRGIRPVRHPWGLWHLPIFYMDNMDFWNGGAGRGEPRDPFSQALIDIAVANDGLYVFDFHPIHLLLNTPDRDRYFAVRDRFKAGEPLAGLVHDGVGTRRFYDALCAALRRHGLASVSLRLALDAHLERGDCP